MQIQVADLRPAFTTTISLAKESNEPLLTAWRDEMVQMVIELSRKLYGAATTGMLQNGLDAAVNLLSIGLLHTTKGGIEPDRWLATLKGLGIKGVSKIVTDLVKACDAITPRHMVAVHGQVEYETTPASRLNMIQRLVEKSPKAAYKDLLSDMADRNEGQNDYKLGRWLIQNTPQGTLIKSRCFEMFGTESAQFDEVCDFILPRVCQIPADLLAHPGEIYADQGFASHDLDKNHLDSRYYLTARAFNTSKHAYDAFVKKLPPGYASQLNYRGQTWFDRTVVLSTKEETEKRKNASARLKKNVLTLERAERKLEKEADPVYHRPSATKKTAPARRKSPSKPV